MLKSRKAFREALELAPNSASAHGQFADYLQDLHRYEEAEAHIRKGLSLRPDRADLHALLIILRLRQGRREEP